jgi:hypothetical protein
MQSINNCTGNQGSLDPVHEPITTSQKVWTYGHILESILMSDFSIAPLSIPLSVSLDQHSPHDQDDKNEKDIKSKMDVKRVVITWSPSSLE